MILDSHGNMLKRVTACFSWKQFRCNFQRLSLHLCHARDLGVYNQEVLAIPTVCDSGVFSLIAFRPACGSTKYFPRKEYCNENLNLAGTVRRFLRLG